MGKCSRSITLISARRDSSLDSLSMLHQDQSAAWSGRDQMLSLPEERCSVQPSHSTLSQEPSEVITALMSEETSATDLTQLIQPTPKLLFGSNQRSLSHGLITPTNGFMSDSNENRNLNRNPFRLKNCRKKRKKKKEKKKK